MSWLNSVASIVRRKNHSTKSRKARRSRNDRRAIFFEALESRHLLSVTFVDDETPPYNDSLANAQPVVSPGLSAGVVDMITSPSGAVVTGDADYYKFQAAVAGDLKISVGYTGGTSNATVTFYDNLDNPTGPYTIDAGNPTASLTVSGVNTANVYKVGIAGTDAQYQLRIWNPDVNDDSTGSPADNNSMNVTSATSLGTFNGTAINTPTYTITRPDRDYFRLISGVTGPVEVRAIMPAGTGAATRANSPTNLGVRVRNSNGVILATSNGTTTDVDLAVFQAVNAQTYYIEVYSGSVGQVNEYNLQITQPTATVTGFKYLDSNLNGFQDWGEPGLQGWTIYVDADNSNTLNGGETSVTTAADGSYSLTLPPGTHVIREVIPVAAPAWLQTYPGADFGDEHTINVSASMVLDHIDFGNLPLASITVIKDAVPDDAQNFGYTVTGAGLTPFSLDDDADPTLSNTQTFTGLAPECSR